MALPVKSPKKVTTPTSAPVTAPPKAQVQSLDISRSNETLDLAKDLAKFIKDNKLSTTVQGKEFVNVEGWQYAGSRLGIVPIVDHCINVSTDAEIRYQAKVTLYDMRHQVTVGAGFAVCSNKESGKKFYQEFAIMSMSQTRATGKAYRNVLAWIIRAAGYEPTPAEEMDYNTNTVAPASTPTPAAAVAQAVPAMQVVPAELQHGDLPAPVQYATAKQKEEIIRLLNHPVITRPEKTKMLLNINRLDEERAVQAISKLRKAIDDREGLEERPKLRNTLRRMANENCERLGVPEHDRLITLAEREDSTSDDLRQAIQNLREDVAA